MILQVRIPKELRADFSEVRILKGLSASADILGEFAFPKNLRARTRHTALVGS